jgi:predicted phosphodiesterase
MVTRSIVRQEVSHSRNGRGLEANRWVQFGIISEIHAAPPGTPPVSWHNLFPPDFAAGLLQPAVDRLAIKNLDYLVLLGDLTHFADSESLDEVLSVAKGANLPLLVAPGNHDVSKEGGGLNRFQRQLLGHQSLTAAPARMALDAGVEVMLLAIDYAAASGGYRSSGPHGIRAQESGLLVLFSHFPILPLADRLERAGFAHAGDLLDRAELVETLMQREGPIVVIHGHLHVHDATTERNVLHLSSGALIEPPHDVSVLSVAIDSSGQVLVRRDAESVAHYESGRVPVLSPRTGSWTFDGTRWNAIDPDRPATPGG